MAGQALVHDALVYGSDDEFVDGLLSFVQGGLDEGEPVVAVIPRRKAGLLRDALGPDADRVEYVDAVEWYRRPLDTISGYRATLDSLLEAGAPRVRVIGEVQFGSRDVEHADWTKYEATLNRIFADSPAWIVCPYDTRLLPEQVVEDARRTHPCVVSGGRREPSPSYVWPHDLVRRLSLVPDVSRGTSLLERRLPPATPSDVRAAVREGAVAAGLKPGRADDLVIALNEVVSNALRHGRGDVLVTLWWTGEEAVCRVVDHGGGIHDYLAGYEPPNLDRRREGGLGLWVARGLADRVDFVDGEESFAVWLTVGR